MGEFDSTTTTALNGPFYCPECDMEYYNPFRIWPNGIEYRVHHCSDSVKSTKTEEE